MSVAGKGAAPSTTMLLVDQLVHLAYELVQVDTLICNLSHTVTHILFIPLLINATVNFHVVIHKVHASIQHEVIRFEDATFRFFIIVSSA